MLVDVTPGAAAEPEVEDDPHAAASSEVATASPASTYGRRSDEREHTGMDSLLAWGTMQPDGPELYTNGMRYTIFT
jgi:hypothetical protein